MKKLIPIIAVTGLLSACALPMKVAQPLNETQMQSMSCKQVKKESDSLNRQIDQLQYSGDRFDFDQPVTKAQALKAAEKRLEQIRSLSVNKLCSFG